MNRDFSPRIDDLRDLITRLKSRCLAAEARVSELQQQLAVQQSQTESLQAQLAVLEDKYRNLQSGLAATGNSPAQTALLKEQYLAMVSEIDACIAQLQHG